MNNSLTRFLAAERTLGATIFTGAGDIGSPSPAWHAAQQSERLALTAQSHEHATAMVEVLSGPREPGESLADFTARMVRLQGERLAAGNCAAELAAFQANGITEVNRCG